MTTQIPIVEYVNVGNEYFSTDWQIDTDNFELNIAVVDEDYELSKYEITQMFPMIHGKNIEVTGIRNSVMIGNGNFCSCYISAINTLFFIKTQEDE